tara:strand:- start:13 stop:339 length:327 start_codon:yes stop_codon:yes gene_type:complete
MSSFGPKHFAPAAWFSIDADAGTPVFFDSFNCSSITDNSAGKQTANFSNALSNNDFATAACCGETATISGFGNNTPKTTSAVSLRSNNASGVATDSPNLDGIVIGDVT